jgi:hypothetical protein
MIQKMDVILYSAQNKAGQRLQQAVEILIPKHSIEVCSTFSALVQRLHQPLDNIKQIVLNVSGKKDLQDVITLRDILWHYRVILVLPHRDAAITFLGHLLRPRLISCFSDSSFLDVLAVLRHMPVADYPVIDNKTSKRLRTRA